MTTGERRLLEGLSRRAETLKRFSDTSLRTDCLIEPVMAMMAGNVMRTLFALCGDAIREDFLRWMLKTLREGHGLCLCGELKAKHDDPLCAGCWKQCEDDDREAEQYEKMDRPVPGVPS